MGLAMAGATVATLTVAGSADAASRQIKCVGQDRFDHAGQAIDDLRVHAGKDTGSAVVGVIPAGTPVPVERRPPYKTDVDIEPAPVWVEAGGVYVAVDGQYEVEWAKVKWSGQDRWVAEGWICETATWQGGSDRPR